jgi:hypothetical protein
MKNTAYVTSGKPIAVLLQSISGVSAINPLVTLYDIHGRKREALFFYFVPDTTRANKISSIKIQSYTNFCFFRKSDAAFKSFQLLLVFQ